jgi:predicted signal transduction protein with EAL and GGDEF domain/FixJ family two-component response regulator
MTSPTSPLRVLVADDDAIQREIAAAMLESTGFEVQSVASGDAAVAACLARMPDIALLDVQMQDGDGFQACRSIRYLPGGADLPIVMVTGLDDTASINGAYDAGATDFVVKPINWPLLGHRIRYVLRGARTIDALRFSEQKNAALLRAIPDGILLVNDRGAIVHSFSPLSDAVANAAGGAAAPMHFLELIPVAARGRAGECLDAALRGTPSSFEFARRLESAGDRHFECRYLPNSAGQALAIVRDITARKAAEQRIHRLAYFDALTGLPNREWIHEYLAHTITPAQSACRGAALLYVDLDQFKRINETLGLEIGDRLLRDAADRLRTALGDVRDGDPIAEPGECVRVDAAAGRLCGQLARVAGDEFLVVFVGETGSSHAQRAAQQIHTLLSAPFLGESHGLVVTPSIGIAVYPEHGEDAQTLLKNADAAMVEAKANGRNQVRVFNSDVSARAKKRLSLEMDLRRAVENCALEVYYQPKYEARNLKLAGGEALLRWFHPERGQVPTGEFIAVAEETGLIGEIGRWTIQQVCRDLCRWRSAGLALPSVAVNVSGRDFLNPESLLHLSDSVSRAQLAASLFEIELTEGVLMHDAEAGRRTLLALKEFGFALAIDDFGTGYCSLNYLKRFPLDTLKIDRSFVADISRDPDDAAIVRAIIALGHSLDLKVVAEGVATDAQLGFLRLENCDLIQGFLMSPAIPAANFAALLQREAPLRAVDAVPARRVAH